MAKPTSPRERQRQQERAQQVARQRESRRARNRRLLFGGLGAVLVLALVAGYLGAIGSGTKTSTSTSTSASTSSTTPPSTIALPVAPAGADLTTSPTPCPAEDGSSPRTTTFAGAPPLCIDPAFAYDAVMRTSKGDIRFFLDPSATPNTVNNFVVLARYHYYDGQPVTSILSRTAFAVSGRIDNPQSRTSPGYSIASEVSAAGTVYTPGTLAMIPEQSDKTQIGAAFLVATFEQAAGLSPTLVGIGTMVDGEDTLIAIDKVGSESAEPIEVVTIESITVTQSVKL